MKKYSDNQIVRARERPIVEVAQELELEMKAMPGGRYRMLCLLHDERRPSMVVGGQRNICKCFSCGGVLDTIGLVMHEKDCSFNEAVRFIIHEEPAEDDAPAKPTKLYLHRRSTLTLTLTLTPSASNSLTSTSASAFYNPAYVRALVSLQNPLSRCLEWRFGREVMARVTYAYQLGNWEDRDHRYGTVFPLIDGQGRVHDLKVQRYETDPQHPRFAHSIDGAYWLGSVLRGMGQFPPEAEFTHDVLFGEHLLKSRPDATVGLVESPKNAVVAACAMPDLTWVATGNKSMLNRQVLAPLRGRNVLVFPDRDAHEEWTRKLAAMRDLANFVISSQGQTESAKSDIADVLLSSPVKHPG